MFHYELRHGDFCLINEQGTLVTSSHEVSLAVSVDGDHVVLHKHGRPESVEAWAMAARKRYRTAGFSEMADQIVVLTGRFPVKELNRILDNSTYIARYYQQLMRPSCETTANEPCA